MRQEAEHGAEWRHRHAQHDGLSKNRFVIAERRRERRATCRPISRMRSVTFVSTGVRDVPMPPTNSEIDATDPMSSENDAIIVSICLMICRGDDTHTLSASRLNTAPRRFGSP